MPGFTVRSVVDRASSASSARDDVVGERAVAPGSGETARFALDHGPFATYERSVTLVPVDGHGDGHGDGDPAGPTRRRGAAPGRSSASGSPSPGNVALPHELADAPRAAPPPPDGHLPWWYPPQRPDARGATVLGLLATLSLVVGYHGTLLSRTMTFAADEFGAGSAAQGDALAVRGSAASSPSASAPSPTAGAAG